MKLLQINTSPILTVEHDGKSIRTGIYKKPRSGPVAVEKLGLEGDQQADKRYHGGEHMAVYALTREVYDHWRKADRRDDLRFGLFGENLTVEGMPDDQIHLGDRFAIGSCEFEVSLPRGPCSKLAMAVKDPGFPKRLLASLRVGFYFRVLKYGTLSAGDQITATHKDPHRVTIAQATETFYFKTKDPAASARLLAVPALGPLWRPVLTERAGR